MYVCICNAVTDKQIRLAVRDGCGSMRDLRKELGVAGCCGKCAVTAQSVMREEQGRTSRNGSACFGDTLVPA
ncbi:bacterioferritin-associated ferredoxin [Chitinimonas lacunae]|uniref:Bacterioferritin-associated ferredoxin n=1 Tax=Chitinimonas lacunae TaxID=1963018 RepID=A0ABV8MPH3_9NEIS